MVPRKSRNECINNQKKSKPVSGNKSTSIAYNNTEKKKRKMLLKVLLMIIIGEN